MPFLDGSYPRWGLALVNTEFDPPNALDNLDGFLTNSPGIELATLAYGNIEYDGVVDTGEYVAAVRELGLTPVYTCGPFPDTATTFNTSGGAIDPSELAACAVVYLDDIVENGIQHLIVWRDMFGMRSGEDEGSTPERTADTTWDIPRYIDLYEAVFDEAKSRSPLIRVYGPNILFKARDEGYDEVYNGVTIDSRDVDGFIEFLEATEGASPLQVDGFAVAGDFPESEWGSFVEYILDLIPENTPLIISRMFNSSPPEAPAPSESFVGDVPPGYIRCGVSSRIGGSVRVTQDIRNRFEIAAGKPVGISRHFRQWDNRMQVISDSSTALSFDRLPWVSIKPPSWSTAGSGGYDGQFDQIINGLKNVGGPVWITLHHEPENDLDGGDKTPANWRAMQSKFRERLDIAQPTNIAFAPILQAYTWQARDPDDYWVDDIWDFFGIDVYTSAGDGAIGTPGYRPGFAAARLYLEDKGLKCAIGEYGNPQFDATGAAENTALYNYCVGSATDGAGCQVIGLTYWDAGKTGDTDYAFPNPSEALTGFRQLIGLSTSLKADEGVTTASGGVTATLRGTAQAITNATDASDLAFWPALPDYAPYYDTIPITDGEVGWRFIARLGVPASGILNAKIHVFARSSHLGTANVLWDQGSFELPGAGEWVDLGNLDEGQYVFTITGFPTSNGNATLSLSIDGDNIKRVTVTDSIYVRAE